MIALPFDTSWQSVFEWLGLLSMMTFLISVLLIPFLVSRASTDYFLTHSQLVQQRHKHHPAKALLIKIIRNGLGLLLCFAGFLMLFLPGQGLLTILIGVSLLDFSWRQKALGVLIHRKAVQKALNWIRRKTGHSPFNFPAKKKG